MLLRNSAKAVLLFRPPVLTYGMQEQYALSRLEWDTEFVPSKQLKTARKTYEAKQMELMVKLQAKSNVFYYSYKYGVSAILGVLLFAFLLFYIRRRNRAQGLTSQDKFKAKELQWMREVLSD